MDSLYEAFKRLCLRQRRTGSVQSAQQFRQALVQLIQGASDEALINLAIDVEDAQSK